MAEPCRKANEIPRKSDQRVKPLASSARGEIVLDNFQGSGTTLIDAERDGGLCFTENEDLGHG
jgi:hypothetical protein